MVTRTADLSIANDTLRDEIETRKQIEIDLRKAKKGAEANRHE